MAVPKGGVPEGDAPEGDAADGMVGAANAMAVPMRVVDMITLPEEGFADNMAVPKGGATEGDVADGMVGAADNMAVPKGGATEGGSLPRPSLRILAMMEQWQ